jgi:hypothetical protein
LCAFVAGLVPQRLAIDAALERQRAIVESLTLNKNQRKARAHNSPPSPPPPPKGNNLKSHHPPTKENHRSPRTRGDNKTSPSFKGANSAAGRVKVKEDKGQGEGHGLKDIVKKLDYSLHSDTEG